MKFYSSLFFLILLVSCVQNSHTSQLQEVKKTSEISVVVHPDFSADSALVFIEEQCVFGPRVPGSEAHKKCSDYLYGKLLDYCGEVQKQSFKTILYDGKMIDGVNLIGRLNPDKKKRVALFAHWDSRPFCDNDIEENWHKPVMGANDGASGVAVLLEVARQLKSSGDSIGVDIVFLDLEDYGQPSFDVGEKVDTWCLGAQHLSRNFYSTVKPKWGILLDMVGGKSPYFGYDQVSLHFAENYLWKVWRNAKKLGYGNIFASKETGAIMDDHYYLNLVASIPTIDIIDFNQERGFPDTWHTVRDVPENIEKRTLQMVGEVVLESIR